MDGRPEPGGGINSCELQTSTSKSTIENIPSTPETRGAIIIVGVFGRRTRAGTRYGGVEYYPPRLNAQERGWLGKVL